MTARSILYLEKEGKKESIRQLGAGIYVRNGKNLYSLSKTNRKVGVSKETLKKMSEYYNIKPEVLPTKQGSKKVYLFTEEQVGFLKTKANSFNPKKMRVAL